MEYEMGVQLADDGLDKRRKKSAIRRKAIKFTKIISLVGLRHATDSRNSAPRRFVWVAWVVFGIGLAVYQIQDRIVYYRAYPSDTEVKLITDEKSLLLPQVTICNDQLEPNSAKNKEMDRVKQLIQGELNELKSAEEKNEEPNIRNVKKKLINLLDELHNITRDWERLSKDLSPSANELIAEVHFNNHLNRSLIEEVKSDLGHCFAFSTAKLPLFSTEGGAPNGLHLVLKTAEGDKSTGFKMLIHDALVVPEVRHNGFVLRPGTVTRVAVSFENVTFQGPPYDSCDNSDPKYRLINCLKTCDYESFSIHCNCRDIHMTGDGRVCSYANIWNCTKIFGSQANANLSTLQCSCGPECNSRIYKTSVTQNAYSFESGALVYVYYQHIAYMSVDSVPAYSFLELLCDIGGALSLLLGATLLTVYEAGEFFLLFLRDYLHLRFAK